MNHRPKKSLGQNFLKNQGVIAKIVDAADPVADDIILEIGPGLGALTEALMKLAGKVIAVEKDDDLVIALREKFSKEIANGKLDLVHEDILKFDPEVLRTEAENKNTTHPQPPLGEGATANKRSEKSYKLVANIPYYITGAIIEKFLSASFQPSLMVVMVQEEVARRIVAKDKRTGGLGKESILSIAVKAYGTPHYISTVRAGSFVPAPKVDSAILAIEKISRKNFKTKHHEEVFFQIVKAGFAHKRKTLAGNLKNSLEPEVVAEAMRAAGMRAGVRAEDVGITQWLAMADVVYNAQYES